MTHSEFTSALTSDSWFDSPQELIDYRLPVVQYFITTYVPMMNLPAPAKTALSRVRLVYDERTDFCMVNEAYLNILQQFKEGILK